MNPTEAEVTALGEKVSNWGRWGQGDSVGTLNILRDGADLRWAAALRGRSISLARLVVAANGPEYESHPVPLHHMLRTGQSAPPQGFAAASDWIGVGCHGFGVTHVDALSHVFWNAQMYGGVAAGLASTSRGSRQGSIDDLGSGIVNRGVLLDVPRARGVKWLDPGETIYPDDLERCEGDEGVTVARGDTLYIRTGITRRQAEVGRHSPQRDGHPGLSTTCIPWLRERDVVVLGSDAVHDVLGPGRSGMPVHALALVYLGMPLIDNADLEAIADACAAERRWTFLSVLAPLRIALGTGSPANPLAVL